MKLTLQQIEKIREHTGLDPISHAESVVEMLEGHFGDHTFYLDEDGLRIWESISEEESPTEKLQGYRIASWAGNARDSLVPHDPVPAGMAIELVT